MRSKDPRPEVKHNRLEKTASPRVAKLHKAMIYLVRVKTSLVTKIQLEMNKMGKFFKF